MEKELIALFGAGVVGQWLSKVVSPTLDDVGQGLRDWLRGKQGKNVQAVVTQAAELTADKNLHEIPTRVFVPLLTAASNEDDPDLQTKWAALLAHSATKPETVLPAYSRILSDLSPFEAKVLDWIYEASPYRDNPHPAAGHHGAPSTTLKTAIESFKVKFEDMFLVLASLDRLGLIATSEKLVTTDRAVDTKFMHVQMTTYGAAFVRVCRPDTL